MSQLRTCCRVVWPADPLCEAFGAPSTHGCGLEPVHTGDHTCPCGSTPERGTRREVMASLLFPEPPAVEPTAAPTDTPRRATDTFELARVAAVARAALANRTPIGKTVAVEFGVNESRAGKLIMLARQHGHDIPRAPQLGTPPVHSREEVTRHALAAISEGLPLAHTVARRMGISDRNASRLIGLARLAGYPIPNVPRGGARGKASEPQRTGGFTFGPPRSAPVVGPKAAAKCDGWTLTVPRPPKPGPAVVGLDEDTPTMPPDVALQRKRVTLEQVAALYVATVEAVGHPISVIAARWDVPRKTAQAWVCMCRETVPALLPPRDQPQVQASVEWRRGAVPRGVNVQAQKVGL